MYLPPVLVPKRNLITHRLPRMDIFVMLIHVCYRRNNYLSLFSQFRIYLGLFLLKNGKLVYLPPVLVRQRDLMTPRILRIDIFVMVIHLCYTRNNYLSLFLQFRIYLGLFLLKNGKLVYLPPVLVRKRDLMTPKILRIDIFVMVIHLCYTRNNYLSLFWQFRIYLGLFFLKTR